MITSETLAPTYLNIIKNYLTVVGKHIIMQ